MILQAPDNKKLLRSFGISAGAVAIVFVLQWLFPTFEWVELRTAVLAAVSGWVINTVKESLK